MPVLKEREGTVSIKELSELTCIKPDDIIYTLQHWQLVQYQKGQHVLVAAPKLLEQCLKEAGSWGLQVGLQAVGETVDTGGVHPYKMLAITSFVSAGICQC